MKRAPKPLEDARSTQIDLEAQAAIEEVPGAERWQRKNVRR